MNPVFKFGDKFYRFEPKQDITTYELALIWAWSISAVNTCLANISMGYSMKVNSDFFLSPEGESVLRHFQEVSHQLSSLKDKN